MHVYCTYTHKRRAHTCTHQHTLTTDSTAWQRKSCQSPKSSTKGWGVSMYQLHNCLGQTKHSQGFVHLGNKEWMVQASAQLQRTFMQTPQLHCSRSCCSTLCSLSRTDPPGCSGWPHHTLGDALHPGLPWHCNSHQVLHGFHLSTEAWLGLNKKHCLDLSSHFFPSSPRNSDNWLFHLIV